ncbi:MAG: phage Gp37/Gp68 family protein [Candidatus Thermoplasmatota archaeon]|nr:phage Gp37/Gp68 family protein [Candidatus Thermoplasmatota archaeon]
MAEKSAIEWTGSTWNPVTGCDKISEGCKNCYAERLALRLQSMGVNKYKKGFKVCLHPKVMDQPFSWKKSQIVFVNSMSDLFHKEVPTEFIKSVFQVMNKASHLTFQVLTKRPERLSELNNELHWTSNIWMGVTVESNDYLSRIDYLRDTDASIKFLSLEPLLSPINGINLKGIHWIIVGGESGPNHRPMKEEWVIEIKEKCDKQNIPFFFKQWGGFNKKKNGRLLNGRIYDQMPTLSIKNA